MEISTIEMSSTIYRWIERRPLSERVSWTYREKFWLVTATCVYGHHNWKTVAQILKKAGEPYRPEEWYTSKTCEHQFKIIVSSIKKEIRIKPFNTVMQNIAEGFRREYMREMVHTNDFLKNKYCDLFNVLNRIKQGNLSRNEIVNLYTDARRNEIEGKQYVEQLMIRQTTWLATEKTNFGLSEEPIKWNTPSAPLLTSLLRSRNTIPANRTVTTITSLLQSADSTSRTRSGKLLSTSPTVRTPTQGTPTLSKLLEAPANPYFPSPQQASQNSKLSDIVETDKLVGNTSKKENSQSASLNRVRMDNTSTSGSFNQTNRIDLSASKKQTPRSPVLAVKNGSKANSNVVNLLSDSDNDESDISLVQSLHPKNLFEDKNENVITNASNSNRIETRATRSQTRAEVGFKHLNDTKLSGGKKDRETLQQLSGESQISETHSIDDELIDIDQIEVEPLTSVQDETINHTPSKITRSSMQRLKFNSPADNIFPIKMKNKEINNQMLEEISANFVLNSSIKNVATEFKNVMVSQSRIDNASLSGCLVPIDASVVKDTFLLRKDGQSFPHPANTLTTFDGKVLKQKRLIEIKGTNLRCIDGRNETKYLTFSNQPIVLVNKIKKPFNIKLASSEAKDYSDDIQVINSETKKTVQLRNSSQNMVQLLDGNSSYTDEVIIIDDDVNINVVEKTKNNESPCNSESQNLSAVARINDSGSNISGNSKSIGFQLNVKTKNDKISWNTSGKHHNILDISSKKPKNHDGTHKVVINSNVNDTNSRFIKELDFDFDQSISQTSLSELYNGVEEIVEMHSFDNEELNSLIECGSLDSNETEEHQNVTNLDQGDSSVSESDSTVGAFDTFAQITKVTQKSSKEIKSINKDSKTNKQVSKDLECDEGIAQSDEVDDDQSTAASVTGIPILQGVISDVMSKIDSDRDAALKTVDSLNESTNEVVEISSDEEESSNTVKTFSSTTVEIEKPGKEIIHKSNKDETKKMKVIDTKSVLINKMKNIIRENKETSVNNSEIKNVKSHTFNMIIKPAAKNIIETESILPVNELESKGTKRKHIALEDEINISSKEIKKTFKESKVKNVKLDLEIVEERLKCEKDLKTKKSAEEKRLKELLDEKIEEEKKIKENEKKQKKENYERKKREEEERKKKEEEEERKRKDEEERKRKEEEKKRIEEERKRKEEEKRIEEERKRKEEKRIEEERKRKEEEKRIEEERKRKEEEKKRKEEEERKRKEAEEIMLTAANIKQEKFDEIEEINTEIIQNAINTVEKNFEEQYGHKFEKINIKNEFEVEIMQRAKKNQLKKAKIAELIKARNIEMKKAKAKELEIAKLKENELLIKAREAEVIRAKEHARQIELRRINEINLQKAIDEEIEKEKQQAQAAEIQRAKIASIKRQKEGKLHSKYDKKQYLFRRECIDKAFVMEFSESENKPTDSEDYKCECEDKDMERVELNLPKSKNDEIKINDVKETSVQPMLEKETEIIASTVKENLTDPAVDRILTRTRGLKNEEKIKEPNFDFKNVNDENKLNHLDTSTVLNDSCERLISKPQVDGKTRTRSSLSYKQVDTVSKVTVGVKKSVIDTHSEVSTTSSEFQKSTVGSVIEQTTFRALTIPLVKLTTNSLPMLKEKMESMRQSRSIKVVTNKLPPSKPGNTNEIKEELSSKKRGRKCIDVQNEELKSKRSKFQNGARTSNKVKSTLSKRTRSRVSLKRKRKEDFLSIKHIANKSLNKNILRIIMKNISESNLYFLSSEKQSKKLYLNEQTVIKWPLNLKSIRNQIHVGSIRSIGDIQRNLMVLSYNNVMLNRSSSTNFSDTSKFQEKVFSNMNYFHYAFSTDDELLRKMNDEDHKYNTDDDDEDYISVNKSIDSEHFIIENCENIGLNEIYYDEPVSCILQNMEFSSDESCSDSESDSFVSYYKKRRKIDQSYVNTSDSNSDDYESDV